MRNRGEPSSSDCHLKESTGASLSRGLIADGQFGDMVLHSSVNLSIPESMEMNLGHIGSSIDVVHDGTRDFREVPRSDHTFVFIHEHSRHILGVVIPSYWVRNRDDYISTRDLEGGDGGDNGLLDFIVTRRGLADS